MLELEHETTPSWMPNDQHHRIAASDASSFNLAPTAIPVHAIVSTTARTLAAHKCDEMQRSEDVLDETVPCGREILNPAFCDLTAQNCSGSTRAEFGVYPVLQAAKDACVCARPKRTERPMRWFSQTPHHSPLANMSRRGHVMSQPPRHTQIIRVHSRSSAVSKCDLSAFRRTRRQSAKRRAFKC